MKNISNVKTDQDKHHRRSIRLKGYDYSQAGAYFVTTSAQNSKYIFGRIVKGKMILNKYSKVVENEWRKTADIRKNVKLDVFVIMPNHFHGIIMITDDGRGTARRAPTVERYGQPVPESLPTIVCSFKSAITKHINLIRNTPGKPVWQRNYYEHVVRNENELNLIRQYILYNPLQWQYDRENPESVPDEIYNKQWGNFENIASGKNDRPHRSEDVTVFAL